MGKHSALLMCGWGFQAWVSWRCILWILRRQASPCAYVIYDMLLHRWPLSCKDTSLRKKQPMKLLGVPDELESISGASPWILESEGVRMGQCHEISGNAASEMDMHFSPIHQSLEQWYKLTASDMGEVSNIWFEYQDLDHETVGNSLIWGVHPQYLPFKSSNSNSEVLSFSILLYSTICHCISMLQCWHGIRCFFCGGCNGE